MSIFDFNKPLENVQ